MPLNSDVFTIVDAARQQSQSVKFAELLTQRNDIVGMLPMEECNSGDSHVSSQETKLPQVFVRRFNRGVPTSMTSEATMRFGTIMYESTCSIDVEHAKREYPKFLQKAQGNSTVALKMYREKKSGRFGQAMAQQVAEALIYGDEDGPNRTHGLLSLMNDNTAENNRNIINGGSTTQNLNTSIYLVTLSDEVISMLYPQGTAGGLETYDEGRQTVTTQRRPTTAGERTGDIALATLPMLLERFSWRVGLGVYDWRGVGRICNINAAEARAGDAGRTSLLDAMTKLDNSVDGPTNAKRIWLMNKDMKEAVELEADDWIKNSTSVTYENVDGRTVTKVRGHAIHLVDRIMNNEALVTAANLQTALTFTKDRKTFLGF